MKWSKIFDHGLTITFTDNNAIYVEAGCAKLAYTDVDEFINILRDALKDQEKFEKEYFSYMHKATERLQRQAAGQAERNPQFVTTLGCVNPQP